MIDHVPLDVPILYIFQSWPEQITEFNFFIFRKSMTEYDPRLVAPTCLYLASKAEESTVQARLLVFYIKKLRKYC